MDIQLKSLALKFPILGVNIRALSTPVKLVELEDL